ncbi:threonine/serine exporter family protein [Pseudonocardia eucalypti]|uniref:Threonine/serine exporter family protein n=1 Tax=Pseudonocardia eucalypti TaxID=648755 RepID=A0ABP9R247_9PSEU|nr:uncharacterized membrane protein YjjP (DUF1212 family)/uncharacterized membrane protein YjjB (DUF3815 family) [Pseudonocardia eucalypti]
MNKFGQRLRGVLRTEQQGGRHLWHVWQGNHHEDSGKFSANEPEAGPSVPDDTRVLRVLDLAMRVGEVLLSSGEGVAETTRIMLRVADAGGLPTCEVDITFTSITMCCHRGMMAAPVTTMRLVRYRSLDLTRLREVSRLVDRIEEGRIELAAATTELDRITTAPHPYPRWLATLAWAGMAGSVAALLGAGWVAALVAFAATGLIDRIGRVLNRYGLPIFFQQVSGALLATGVTAALIYFRLLPAGTLPSLVVAAALTVLLSGLSVVGSVRDAIDGFFLTAMGRSGEIVMYSAGLLAGVVIALKGALVFGVELAVAGPLPSTSASMVARGLAAAATAGLFALAGYSPVRYLPAAAGTGLIGWVIYTLLYSATVGPVVATGIAAIALGLVSGLLHRWTGVPHLVITLAAICPLLPGLTAYRGFYQLAVTGVADGLVTVLVALAVGLALAGGVALGEWFIERVWPVRSIEITAPMVPSEQ